MAVRRLWQGLERRFRENLDLAVLWAVLLVAQPMLPVGNFLARDDLVPWLMLALSGAALLRGRHMGQGPHPMLTRRHASFGWLTQRLARAAAPWALMLWYDGAGNAAPAQLGSAAGLALGIVVLMAMGGAHERTAWNPAGTPAALVWFAEALVLAILVGVVGWVCGPASAPLRGPIEMPPWLGPAFLVGVGFLTVGLLSGRVRNLRQRKAAGLRDGTPYRIALAPALLAVGGTGIGLALLLLLFPESQAFHLAFVGTLHVVVWASVLWPRREPIARACILHEVIPTGGGDKETGETALSFERPPAGALRFNPLRTKRIMVMHPWLVPVRGARIEQLDDPIQPLWPPPTPFQRHHVLGEATFEPDPVTRRTQWNLVSLKMSRRQDVSTVETGSAQSRRIVVLRAFPAPGSARRRRLATYRWEEIGPQESIQILDATARSATLRDGDLLVLSSEGVARAYEVELGAPLYSWADAEAFRPPQLEDYVEAGS
jgi:hypothetical protein